jgi:D-glycero-D-manno-heptose 1,7-bisphosphate phosphatase
MTTEARGASGPPETRRPAVFLDRDGTLIRDRDYLADPSGVELLPGAVEALTLLRAGEFALVVVTNQSGIARGHFGELDYQRVAERLDTLLAEAGLALDGSYHCPHHPEVGGPCPCRKPATGLHRRAARELGLSLRDSWFVGDRVSDVLPARELGGRGILVRTGYGEDEMSRIPARVPAETDLLAAARRILAHT